MVDLPTLTARQPDELSRWTISCTAVSRVRPPGRHSSAWSSSIPTTPPRWVVDPDFDLDYHVRRVALPAPGTLRQFLDLAEVTLPSPLDTSRPRWEAVYVEGLAGDRSALLTKLSHAITDGLGGVALFEQVYDTERDPAPRPTSGLHP